MKRVTLRVPTAQVEAIDRLVDQGTYPSRSEAIRAAVRALVDGRLRWPDSDDSAVADGGAAATQAHQDTLAEPDTRWLTRLSAQALEGRHLEAAFERAGSYHAVSGEIVTVRDGTHDRDRRTLVLEDGSVVPVAGLLGYDLSARTQPATPDAWRRGDRW